MGEIRHTRERLGLTLDELAERTRIPVEHLQALEDGRVQDLPAGPYAEMYRRSVREVLGLTEVPPPPRTAHPPARPLSQVRAIAAVPVVAVLLLVGWQGWSWWSSLPPPPDLPDLEVEVIARRNTQIAIEVDGKGIIDRTVAGSERIVVTGRERVSVEVPATQDVRVQYNGERIVPQGRQDAPRRLVFIDDL